MTDKITISHGLIKIESSTVDMTIKTLYAGDYRGSFLHFNTEILVNNPRIYNIIFLKFFDTVILDNKIESFWKLSTSQFRHGENRILLNAIGSEDTYIYSTELLPLTKENLYILHQKQITKYLKSVEYDIGYQKLKIS